MRIQIVTPSYSGRPVPAYLEAVKAVVEAGSERGHHIEATILPHCTILPLARSKLAAIALAKGAEKIVFIDDDGAFRAEDFFAVVEAPYDIVSMPFWCNATTLSYNAQDMLPKFGDRFHRVISNGFGLMSISNYVFGSIKGSCVKINEKEFRQAHGEKAEHHLHNYFSYDVRETKFIGEDVNFCRIAGSYGFSHNIYCCGITYHFKRDQALVLDLQRLICGLNLQGRA